MEAPLGTIARAKVPSSRSTSHSTVGLPRESRISRAPTASITATCVGLLQVGEGRCAQQPNVGRSIRDRGQAPTYGVAQRLLGVDARVDRLRDQGEQPVAEVVTDRGLGAF